MQYHVTLGPVTLKIHQDFDEGVYGCSFRDKQVHGDAFIYLKVAGEQTGFDFSDTRMCVGTALNSEPNNYKL